MNTTFIDTHCHLNFKRFNKTREAVIQDAQKKGVTTCVVPGTDVSSSQKAVEIASLHPNIYAAIGIHPHHTIESLKLNAQSLKGNQLERDMNELEKLIVHPKVVAVGEIGLDAHEYEETKYEEYQISDEFINAQKEYFISQIQLAKKYKKTLIIHNRETKKELLELFQTNWAEEMRFHTVFHCCEPDNELFAFAQSHNVYIGIDGDVTYGGEKELFAQRVPLEMLVLETDSPFLLPEPLKSQKLYPNSPVNIPLIAEYIAKLKGVAVEEIGKATTQNARRLFGI